MRMQPCDTKPPIEPSLFVPWMAYWPPPESLMAATPTGFFGRAPGDHRRQRPVVLTDRFRRRPSRSDVLAVDVGGAGPLHADTADAHRIKDRFGGTRQGVRAA